MARRVCEAMELGTSGHHSADIPRALGGVAVCACSVCAVANRPVNAQRDAVLRYDPQQSWQTQLFSQPVLLRL